MAQRRKPVQARPFAMILTKPDGKRLPVRRYETETGARIGAARLLGEYYDGRRGHSQPVARITGPDVSFTLTKHESTSVVEGTK